MILGLSLRGRKQVGLKLDLPKEIEKSEAYACKYEAMKAKQIIVDCKFDERCL